MAKQRNISSPKIGMNRANSPHLVNEGEFLFQLNGNSYDSDGEKYNLTDEHSNILASKFKSGFKFVGGKVHVVRNKTYIFLTNPTTKVSEIGCIQNDQTFSLPSDVADVDSCKDCNNSVFVEPSPLEDQTQTEHQTYVTLLEDSCNLCLGFDINNPIVDIIIKEENIGTTLWWTSTPGNKEFRYLELDNLDQYLFEGTDSCDIEPQPTCLDCNKLRVFKLYSEIKTTNYFRSLGGNLKKGSYEVFGAYSDVLGNEFTSYFNLTPIIPIFDEANIIHEQEDDNAETNFSIRLELDNLDTNFDYYKIVFRYYTSLGVFTTFEEGVHNISDNNVIISNTSGKSISNNKVSVPKPFIDSVDGITSANNLLILNGVREREPINLQPVINLAGLGVKWMSFRAKEDLYANANSYKYTGYNRDENVMLSIDFGFKDGYRTNPQLFIPRPPTLDELSDFTSAGDDYDSIASVVGDCDGTIRDKKWQFYNTATEIGVCPLSSDIDTVNQTEEVVTYTQITVPSVPADQLIVDLSDLNNFVDLTSFIETNIANGTISELGVIEPYVDLANLTGFNSVPDLPAATCDAFSLDSEEVEVLNIENEDVSFVYPADSTSYQSIRPPSNVSVFQTNGLTLIVDEEFSFEFNSTLGTGDLLIPYSAKKIGFNYNDSCNQAQDLQRITNGDLRSIYGAFYFNNEGYLDINDFLESSVTMPAGVVQGALTDPDGRFYSNLHKHALWFKTERFGRDRFYINISTDTLCQTGTRDFGGTIVNFNSNQPSLVRVSIFDKCSSTSPIYSAILDINNSNFIDVDSTILSSLTNDELFISIESSIVSARGLGEDWEQYVTVETEADGDRIYRYTAGATEVDTFILNSPCGAFAIVDRDEEPDSATISWDSINLAKTQKYRTSCTFEIPVLQDCEPVPFKYGELGYYESTEKYPDNEELYDSSNLIIDKSKITNADLLSKLNEYYVDTDNGTQLTLSSEADFTCKNIRAYKLPDNNISPFIITDNIASNSDSIISPLGFTIDGEVISNLLDVAVDNNLITQDQRDNIVNYKIYRSDSTLDRSVVSSGLVFNTKKYNVEGEDINYFNYPFNSLGEDKYFNGNTDTDFDKFQVISPEFDYFRPSLPDEMSIQGFMFGKSNSRIIPVDNHSKMVILGNRARSLADTLAILEVTTELIIQTAQASANAQVWGVVGFTNGASFGTPAFISAGVIAAVGALEGFVSRVGRYRLEWERTFENLGAPYNFGYYTASGSNYNYLKTLQTDGDRLRGLSIRKYLKSGMLNVSDTTSGKVIRVNNIDREEAPFFSLGNFPINNLDPEYTNYDNSDVSPNFSSQLLSSEIGCDSAKSPEQLRNIASPYVSFKNYIPNQYGSVGSIKWIDTTYCIDISESGICNGILGGDTFISRHSKKRKTRIFETDLLGSADLTPFPYRFYSNYGEANYYIDYKINSEFRSGNQLFPSIFYDVKFDCNNASSGFYVEPPGKFYLYAISFVNFLCETRINTNFRNARKEPWNQFYPQNTDYEAITQPDVVSLTRNESFFYNKAYLQTGVQSNKFLLPDFYSKEDEARKAYNKNSGIYSLPDVNENSITEPWLLYRPNDKFTLRSEYGDLINMKGIESDQIMMYFENATQIQNTINPFTDGSTEYNSALGNGGIFSKRPITLRTTDLGYGGSQSKHTLSCEFGHFHADVARGQVFNYTGGNDLQEISRYSNGNPNGMDTWFKEHLPIKFKKQFPDYTGLDNPYNSIGIHWGYDSKYRRVILTKKDYILSEGVSLTYDPETNLFDGQTFQERVESGDFKDVSWTLTFKPETGSWESYMSYVPNYYLNHPTYFQSGINSEDDTNGLWSHLLTNKSYRVFYGQKFPYIVEYPVKNEYFSKSLDSVSWNAYLKRYHNEYDFAPIVTNPFDSVTIFNSYENSGNLKPILNTGSLSQLSKYPITNSDNTQDVLVSYDNYRYNLNYFYNRVISNKNNQYIWTWDENQIDKSINPNAVSFFGKKTLERMKGNYFVVRLERNGNTNYDLDFRWSEQTVKPIR